MEFLQVRRTPYEKAAYGLKLVQLVNVVVLVAGPAYQMIHFRRFTPKVEWLWLDSDLRYEEAASFNWQFMILNAITMLLLACLLLVAEFSQQAQSSFYFYNFAAGKALLLLVTAPLFLVPLTYLGICIAGWLAICALGLFAFSCWFRKEEAELYGRVFEKLKLPKHEESQRYETYQNIALAMKTLSLFTGLFMSVGCLVGLLFIQFSGFDDYYTQLPTSTIFKFYEAMNIGYLIGVAVLMLAVELSATLRRQLYFLNFGWGRGLLHALLGLFIFKAVYLYEFWWFILAFPCFLFACCLFYFIVSCCHADDEAIYVHRQLQRDEAPKDKLKAVPWHRMAVRLLQTLNAASMVAYICLPTFLMPRLCFQANAKYCMAGLKYTKFPQSLLLGSAALLFLALEYSPKVQQVFFILNLACCKGLMLLSLVPLCFVPLNSFYLALGIWFTVCAIGYCLVSITKLSEELDFAKNTQIRPIKAV